MRTGLIVFALSLMLLASVGNAQPTGRILLCADESGLDCAIPVAGAGNVDVHVIYTGTMSITAIQFAAPKPDCWRGAVWVSDNTAYLSIGDSQGAHPSGWSIALGACMAPPVYLGSITYRVQAPAPACCEYPVIKASIDLLPEIPHPIVADCTDWPVIYGTGAGVGYINGDDTCPCMIPTPVAETTWGALKALYQ
jgi:hypothetical protein